MGARERRSQPDQHRDQHGQSDQRADQRVVPLRRRNIDGGSNDRIRRDTDAWSTDDLGYSPSNFYIKSTDDHGQTATVRAGISPGLHAELKAIVESGLIPEYRTIGDIIRDALHHRMHWLADRIDDGSLQRRVTTAVRIAEMQRANYDATMQQEFIAVTTRVLQELRTAGDSHHLASVIEDTREHAAEIREPYRTQILGLCDAYQIVAEAGAEGDDGRIIVPPPPLPPLSDGPDTDTRDAEPDAFDTELD